MTRPAFFPDYPVIPYGVGTHVLSSLKNDEDLARMREVSKVWNTVILGDTQLKHRLIRAEALVEAERLLYVDDYGHVREMAKIFVSYNGPKAWQIISSLQDPILLSLANEMAIGQLARYDFPRARALAMGLPYPQRDPVLAEIVRSLAPYDLTAAQTLIREIHSPYFCNMARKSVVIVLAQTDILAAKALSLTITDELTRILSWCEIACIQAKLDIPGAVAFADTIDQPYSRVEAFTRIAQTILNRFPKNLGIILLVLSYLRTAKDMIPAIGDAALCDECRRKIVAVEALIDPVLACETVQTMEIPINQKQAFILIVKTLAKDNIKSAIAFAATIEDEELRKEAKDEIIIAQGKKDIRLAKKLITQRSDIALRIIEEVVQTDILAAKALVQIIDLSAVRASGWILLAKAAHRELRNP